VSWTFLNDLDEDFFGQQKEEINQHKKIEALKHFLGYTKKCFESAEKNCLSLKNSQTKFPFLLLSSLSSQHSNRSIKHLKLSIHTLDLESERERNRVKVRLLHFQCDRITWDYITTIFKSTIRQHEWKLKLLYKDNNAFMMIILIL